MQKLTFSFDPENLVEGGAEFAHLLGNKGANLCEMSKLGLPVPEGVILSTDAHRAFTTKDSKLQKAVYLTDTVREQVIPPLNEIIQAHDKPLLFSVRSGAPVSMAGMMDTILNVGINLSNASDLVQSYGAPTVLDCALTFVQGFYSSGSDSKGYLATLDNLKATLSGNPEKADEELTTVLETFKVVFDLDLLDQIDLCIFKVLESWDSSRAIEYRRINGIDPTLGTAVIMQRMVYGNLNTKSGSGVVFSSCPNTGDKQPSTIYGEYLPTAQGENVVNGTVTPLDLWQAVEERQISKGMYNQLVNVCETLEKHFNDIQDVEFTVEDKRLYVLQTRSAKRTGKAAVNFALALLERGDLTPEQLPTLINPKQALESIEDTVVTDEEPMYKGIVSGSGIVRGVVCTSQGQIEAAKASGLNAIYLAYNTSTEDIDLINKADAVITTNGGFTCHAAVVCRALNKPCIVGISNVSNVSYKEVIENLTQFEAVIVANKGLIYWAENVEVLQGNISQLDPLLHALGIDTDTSNEPIELSTLEPHEAAQIIKLRLKRGDLNLKYSGYKTSRVRPIFGATVYPTNLKPMLDMLNDLSTQYPKGFTLVCDYNLTDLCGSLPDYLITRPDKPSELLTKTKVVSNDAVLAQVFGTLAAAKLFMGAVEKDGVSTAEVYREYESPLSKLLTILQKGSN
ncbi:pyruvate phosphate dikinase [Vibrio phage vB_VhaS-VHB1]|nr:pyruvate phosphate dikinase [Vibrio phage vB_VhaS-VHB1]